MPDLCHDPRPAALRAQLDRRDAILDRVCRCSPEPGELLHCLVGLGGYGNVCGIDRADCDTDGVAAVRAASVAAMLAHGPCWRPDFDDCDTTADALTVERLDAGLRRERTVLDQLRAEWVGTEPELGGAFGGPGTFTAYVPRNGRYRLADPRETILPAALRERIGVPAAASTTVVRIVRGYADEPEDDGDTA